MRRMNKLWMLALAAAMLVTGALSEQYRTAHAETVQTPDIVLETTPAVEVAEGIGWDATLEEAVGLLARSSVQCSYGEENGRMAAKVVADGGMICGYPAEQVSLFFHDETLCMAIYRLEAECSPVTFAMLDMAFRQRYGEPASVDSDEGMSFGCGALNAGDGEMDAPWWRQALDWCAWPFSTDVRNCRAWTVGDHTRIVLMYAQGNTFMGKDYIEVAFVNRHPNQSYELLDGQLLATLVF